MTEKQSVDIVRKLCRLAAQEAFAAPRTTVWVRTQQRGSAAYVRLSPGVTTVDLSVGPGHVLLALPILSGMDDPTITATPTAVDAVLDAYFARIGYHGSRTATVDTLSAIHRLHTAAIPFENLSPFLSEPVLLDRDSLVRKLLHSGRGGYCFEHNLLLRYVLTTLGFAVTNLAARVRWNAPDDVITARGHMLLRVDVDGRSYIVDAGFGGQTLTGPVRLELDAEQPTPHEPFRVVADPNGYLLQAKVGEQWRALYSFDLQPQYQIDYEVTNWYLSNHPSSHFRTGLSVARADDGRRYGLRNTEFAIHYTGGATERRSLATTDEVCAVLQDVFRITLPDSEQLEPALQRLITAATVPSP